jgi:hypothetical protein
MSILNANELSKVLSSAYRVVLDTDDVKVIKKEDLFPPSYVHQYIAVNVFFTYKLRQVVVYHKLFYDKFPKQERKGLSYDQWMDMLDVAEKFPKLSISKDLIKGNNPLVRFNVVVFELVEKEKLDYFNYNRLGEKDDIRNVGDVIKTVKAIIDKLGGDKEEDDEPVVPQFPPPEKFAPQPVQ